jgi:hypothetical protein
MTQDIKIPILIFGCGNMLFEYHDSTLIEIVMNCQFFLHPGKKYRIQT